MGRSSTGDDLQNSFAKLGQVVGLAAGDEMPVDHDGRVLPASAGVDEIVMVYVGPAMLRGWSISLPG
jgi:hypothetical protein